MEETECEVRESKVDGNSSVGFWKEGTVQKRAQEIYMEAPRIFAIRMFIDREKPQRLGK